VEGVERDQGGRGRAGKWSVALCKTESLKDTTQPLHLGLFRSDYLLHTGEGDGLGLKQVEFNTISSSFGSLSDKVAAMHRWVVKMARES
jgi:hypothetical protein